MNRDAVSNRTLLDPASEPICVAFAHARAFFTSSTKPAAGPMPARRPGPPSPFRWSGAARVVRARAHARPVSCQGAAAPAMKGRP